PPCNWANPKDGKQARRGSHASEAQGLVGAGKIVIRKGNGRRRFEYVGAIGVVAELQGRNLGPWKIDFRKLVMHCNQAVWCVNGKTPEQNRIHNAENRRVRADTKR